MCSLLVLVTYASTAHALQTKAVRLRRTCRAFERRPVSQETVEELLWRASRAPSGGNTQPWHIYVPWSNRYSQSELWAPKRPTSP